MENNKFEIKIGWDDIVLIQHNINVAINKLNSISEIIDDYIEDNSISNNLFNNKE